jgi:hypothetical protein
MSPGRQVWFGRYQGCEAEGVPNRLPSASANSATACLLAAVDGEGAWRLADSVTDQGPVRLSLAVITRVRRSTVLPSRQ